MKKQNTYHPLSAKEKTIFRNHPEWNHSIEKLFMKTGIRLIELWSLFKEYNPLHDYVIIKGKGYKERKIPLTTNTKQLLEIWRDQIKWKHIDYNNIFMAKRLMELQNKAKSPQNKNYVANLNACITKEMRSSSRKIDAFRKQVSRSFKIAHSLKSYGNFNPHRFRATFATNLIDNGNDLVTIQTLMGHASVNQTARYIKISDLKLRNAIETLEPHNTLEGMTKEELMQEVLRLRMRLTREATKWKENSCLNTDENAKNA